MHFHFSYLLYFSNTKKAHKSFSNSTNDKNMKIPEAIVISSDNVSSLKNIILHQKNSNKT